MRIAVLGPGHPFRGGIAKTTTALAAALVERDHHVLFAVPVRQYPAWLYPGRDDRDPAACAELAVARPWLDPFAPATWPAARRQLLAWAADAWVVPYWTWPWSGLWWWLMRRPRPPVLGLVHNLADHGGGGLHRLAARLVLGRCDALFTHAAALAAGLRATYPGVAVSHHPLAADEAAVADDQAAARRRLGLPNGARLALFLGLIRPYKGVDLLLEAVAGLPADSDWQLVVAGEAWGDLAAELERRAAGDDLAGRVHLRLGWVPEGEVTTLLTAADVVVLPYRSGSQSAVAPQALAHGRPLVSTRVGGLPEVVRDGVNGLLVAPGDVAGLRRALASLDRDRLAALAGGARASRGALTWDAYAAAVERALTALLASSS